MLAHNRQPEIVPQGLDNIEGEALLLGSLLTQNARADMIADVLHPDDFAEPVHALIYQAVLEAVAKGQHASPVTLAPLFRNDARFDAIGGAAYLAKLTSTVSLLVDVRSLADQIADLAARRRLLTSLEATKLRVTDPDRTLLQLVDDADTALVAAVERRDAIAQPTVADALDEVLARIAEIKANDGRVGATTGISDIDALLGGFEPGQFVIVAGRPGMGKTAVACSAALGCARQGHGVLFVSLEMRALELGMRIASDMCFDGRHGIPFSRIVNAEVNDLEVRQIARARSEAEDMPLTIVDAGSVSIPRLALSVRRHKRRMAARGQELKLVVIDYVQLLKPGGKVKDRYEAITEISIGLKALAKDTGIAVLALAQLNRQVEGRDDKRPVLSDLKESGQLEQDADAVMFLYREEYYLAQKKPKKLDQIPDWERSMAECAGRIDFILAKRRNGRTGSRAGYYYSHYQAVRGSDDRQDEFL